MVVAVRHRGRTILLTGDLDAEGRTQVLGRRRELVDVLMAPHHGGKTANPPELPDEVVRRTRDKYVEAYERLTGRAWQG